MTDFDVVPHLIGRVGGFADAIGVTEQDVAGFESKFAVGILGEGKQADGRTACREPFYLAGCGAEQHGLHLARVDISELAHGRIELATEECGVAFGTGEGCNSLVKTAHELGERGGRRHDLSADRGLDAGHEHCGGDAFAGDIAEGEEEAPVGHLNEVVVVATDGFCGAAGRGAIEAREQWMFLGEEPLLHIAGDLEFAQHEARRFRFEAQALIFNCRGGITGGEAEQVYVFGTEAIGFVQGLKRADDGSVGRTQWNDEQRSGFV